MIFRRLFPLSLIVIVVTLSACSASKEDSLSQTVEQIEIENFLGESDAEKSRRMAWWKDARFGMFIHWGLYAVPAGEYQGRRSDRIGEWIQAWANIPREEYEEFADEFNPVDFDAAEWVGLAKQAGMRYLVITSKHHDGFALFDSKVSDYDIIDATPYPRDLLAELSQECERQGVPLGFYYSIMDWHHPSQYVDVDEKHRTAGHHQNQVFADQKEDYVSYMKAQLYELITRYDPVVLWFDGEWVDWWTEEDGKALYNYVRSLKPDIIINNRVGKGRQGMQGLNKGPGYAGDFGTPEQEIPPTGLPGIDWESCMTMNNTWGYKSYDDDWKSAENLIENLVDIASKGGNYLLNVGPTAQGEIPQPSIDRLQAIGEWMDIHGESIHGTGPSPFALPHWGRATQKRDRLYLHLLEWPEGGSVAIPPLSNPVQRITFLSRPDQELEFSGGEKEVRIRLPEEPPDPYVSVLRIDLEGVPRAQ